MASPSPDPKLMNQKDISREYGIPTRDILYCLHTGRNFPRPVQVLGAKRWFRRTDVARFFKDRPSDQPEGPSAPAAD